MNNYPSFLTLNLTEALAPIRDLQICRTPALSELEMEEIIIKLMNAMSDESDVQYAFAAFAYDVEFIYFGPNRHVHKPRNEIQERLKDAAQIVFRELRELGCYIGGQFPYMCIKTRYLSEVTLQRVVDQAFRFAE